MCGITGAFFPDSKIASSKKDQIIINSTLRKSSIRGEDSYGIFTIREGKVLKEKHLSSSIKNSSGFSIPTSKGNYPIGLVSNARACPTTELKDYAIDKGDIQPFISKSGRWVVSHNGIISNDEKLWLESGIDWCSPFDSPTDSSVITHLLDLYAERSKDGMKTVQKVLQKLEGSFALVIYDIVRDQLFLATNFMPIYFCELKNGILAASIPEMLPSSKIWEVEPYTCIRFQSSSNGKNTNSDTIKWINQNSQGIDYKKVVITYSGGIDSIVNARLYQALGYKVVLLHFTYDHSAELIETMVTKRISKLWNLELKIINIGKVFSQISTPSRLLNKKNISKKEQLLDAESTLSYVGNRNMIFASMAGSFAENIGAGKVVVNMNLGDSIYPDNGYLFMKSINKAFSVSMNHNHIIKFTSPLIHLEKHELVKLGIELFVDWKNAVSCYYPIINNDEIYHCGNCGCDLQRYHAFLMNGYSDPANYTVNPTKISKEKTLKFFTIDYKERSSKEFILDGNHKKEMLQRWPRVNIAL